MANGSVYKRGDNWYLSIYTGRTVDGKRERIRRRAKGETRREAGAELNDELYRLQRQAVAPFLHDENYSIATLRDDWVKSLELSVANPRTRVTYTFNIDKIVNHLVKHGLQRVEDIDLEAIEDFQRAGMAAGRANRTINLSTEKLKKALQWAVDRKLIAVNPLEKTKALPGKRKKFRRDLTREESAALLKHSSPVMRPLWFFLLSTGLRKNEALSLLWADVNLGARSIRIAEREGFDTKTESSERTVPMSPAVFSLLEKMAKSARGRFVFGRSKDGDRRKGNLNIEFNRHMERALRALRGVPFGRRLSSTERDRYADALKEIEEEMKRLDIHSLRYTFVTELIASGVDPKTVQMLAGHKSISTTLAIYAQCRNTNATIAVETLPWELPD